MPNEETSWNLDHCVQVVNNCCLELVHDALPVPLAPYFTSERHIQSKGSNFCHLQDIRKDLFRDSSDVLRSPDPSTTKTSTDSFTTKTKLEYTTFDPTLHAFKAPRDANNELRNFTGRSQTMLSIAVEAEDFQKIEDLALELWRLARGRDMEGIRKITNGVSNIPCDSCARSQPPCGPSSGGGTPTFSSTLAKKIGKSQKYSISPLLTSVTQGSSGISSHREAFRVKHHASFAQESQAAIDLLNVVEPMMESASRQSSGQRLPYVRCSDLQGFKRLILSVARQATMITAEEPRLVQIPSPCYVLGDIHGNLADLEFFRQILWPVGPAASAGSFLFLGDYVDRGLESLQVIAYLMAMKVLNKTKWLMIRGNHETRDVNGNQEHYQDGSFLTQCINTFGTVDGRAVWESINDFFDVLPLAASIDGAIFCVHGGIPQQLCEESVSLIEEVRCPLNNPPQGSMVFDMLWSDPSQEKTICQSKDGFGISARGCKSFSMASIDKFLQNNNFQHILRGHEAKECGVDIGMDDRVTTIFSTSKDHFPKDCPVSCGGVLVSNGEIHVIVRPASATSSAAPAPQPYRASWPTSIQYGAPVVPLRWVAP